jgi:hypothetical protein
MVLVITQEHDDSASDNAASIKRPTISVVFMGDVRNRLTEG